MSIPSAARSAQRSPAPMPADDWALFLDVDGCLLEFASTPAGVAVPAHLIASLQRLAARLDGALALVSGRSLETLDELFAPLRLPAAGLHGLERRDASGTVHAAPPPSPLLAFVRASAQRIAAEHAGAVVEDKGTSLALHWRAAPAAAAPLRALAESVLTRLPGYRVQPGDHVIELRPAAADKGDAIVAFLDEPPFCGRVPVFAGDDLTDEHGFEVINACGGLSILVGEREPSAAHFALRDPAAVHAWLDGNHGDAS